MTTVAKPVRVVDVPEPVRAPGMVPGVTKPVEVPVRETVPTGTPSQSRTGRLNAWSPEIQNLPGNPWLKGRG